MLSSGRMQDAASDPTSKLIRRLRITQLGLAVALVGVALPYIGLGPAPAELRARNRVVVGPNRNMVLSAGENSGGVTYQGPEGVGFDVYCQRERCSLSLRSNGESTGFAELVASDDPRLSLSASEGTQAEPAQGDGGAGSMRHAMLTPDQLRLSSATATSDGFVVLAPSQLHLAKTRQGSVLIEADEAPTVSLSGVDSFRVYRSTDPDPTPPSPSPSPSP